MRRIDFLAMILNLFALVVLAVRSVKNLIKNLFA